MLIPYCDPPSSNISNLLLLLSSIDSSRSKSFLICLKSSMNLSSRTERQGPMSVKMLMMIISSSFTRLFLKFYWKE